MSRRRSGDGQYRAVKYREEARAAQGSRCFWCGCQMTDARANHGDADPFMVTADHVVPWSSGGLNTRENIVASCLACNKKRGRALVAQRGEDIGAGERRHA